jgi:hypothetical protein
MTKFWESGILTTLGIKKMTITLTPKIAVRQIVESHNRCMTISLGNRHMCILFPQTTRHPITGLALGTLKIITETTRERPARTLGETPERTPARTPAETPEGTLARTPARTPGRTLAETLVILVSYCLLRLVVNPRNLSASQGWRKRNKGLSQIQPVETKHAIYRPILEAKSLVCRTEEPYTITWWRCVRTSRAYSIQKSEQHQQG